jgi:hypothetical protein
MCLWARLLQSPLSALELGGSYRARQRDTGCVSVTQVASALYRMCQCDTGCVSVIQGASVNRASLKTP